MTILVLPDKLHSRFHGPTEKQNVPVLRTEQTLEGWRVCVCGVGGILGKLETREAEGTTSTMTAGH